MFYTRINKACGGGRIRLIIGTVSLSFNDLLYQMLNIAYTVYTVKKNVIFPAGESLVSGLPAGDGKIVNIFYSVCCSM